MLNLQRFLFQLMLFSGSIALWSLAHATHQLSRHFN